MPLPPARTRFLAAALLPVLLATLWPFPGHEPEGFISCIACGEHATTDVLLNPSLPDAPYYGQWTPSLAHLELYRGRVLDATLSGLPVTPGPIPDSRLVRDRLAAAQGFSLRVRAVAGPRTPALAALFAIYDDHEREIVLLGPDRDDLVLRFRALATELRFDQPDIRLVSALQHVRAGDTLDITVTRGGARQEGDYGIALNGRSTSGLGCAVGCGWALLMYPEVFPPWLRLLLRPGWVGGLFAPAGFWVRTRGRGLFAAAGPAT